MRVGVSASRRKANWTPMRRMSSGEKALWVAAGIGVTLAINAFMRHATRFDERMLDFAISAAELGYLCAEHGMSEEDMRQHVRNAHGGR